jgi:hypothetical protein
MAEGGTTLYHHSRTTADLTLHVLNHTLLFLDTHA